MINWKARALAAEATLEWVLRVQLAVVKALTGRTNPKLAAARMTKERKANAEQNRKG